ncbi:tandem-95 repeat protein, partial [Litoribacillus peritrichatus]|uniref:beta strand repeat-containing protein n=1 Tax=Litoribacillus peritrichatus TaxID=718191 RepID=UPI0031DE5EAC
EGGASYAITSTSDVEITSATQFSVTLTGQDQTHINGLLNKNGTSSDDATTFNLAAADNWMAGAAANDDIADTTGNGVTVSNVTAPAVTSATYDATTGVLVVTGTHFSSLSGAANDVDISTMTLTGEAGNTYTLTSATDVDISSATQVSVTLSGADKTHVDGLLNKNGTSSDDATTFNLAVADDWMAGAASTTDIADATNGVTVSNVTVPTITSATYDGTSGTLVVTGTNLRNLSGATNDVDLSKLTLSGQGAGTYTLTSDAIEITDATSFTLVLNATDQSNLAVLLNKNGTSAVDSTVYNLSAADNWMPGAAATTDLSDTTGNAITVANAAKPTVILSANTNTVAEAAGTSVIRATLSAASSVDVVVNLAYSGTATNVADYSTTGNSITISSGSLTGNVTLQAVQDAAVESNETIIVDIDSITGNTATEATTQQQTVTITDDDTATVTLSASASTIAEAAGTSTLTATLDQATFENVTVSLGYSGTATNGTDYVTPAGSITIAAGQTTGTTTLTAAADSVVEAGETIIVDVTNVSGGSASESGIQQQTVTITDDDTATVTLTASANTIAEAAGTSTLTATLDQATFENVTVSLGYSGTATSGTDYVTPAGSITITAGQTTGTTTLTATADSNVEAGETIIVDVTNVSGGSASENGTQQQTVTITDDDTATVTLSASAASIAEAAGTSTLTATLDSATFENVTVSLGYSGTATSGTDYVTPAGSITITAGQTTGTATLTATADSNVEAGETIIVDVTNVSGGSASESGIQQQTVTITDDDTATVTLTASANTIAEAAGTSTLTATLDSATFENVTVSLGYSGTATSGTDYATPAGSITIPAGQTTGTTTLTATADSVVEAGETIIVDVTNVSGGSASESGIQQQTVTITDDDTATVTLTASANTIAEAAGSSVLTATLDQATFENVTVSLGYSGTATSGTDYATPAGSITIAAGQTTGTTTLTATADSNVEAGETIIVDVTNVSGGSASESGIQQQTVTITDDDTATVTLTASANTIAEAAGTSTLTATLDQATFENVTVSLGYSGTATSGTDYVTPAGSITITAGQTTGTAILTAIQDSSEESDETIIVDVTGVSGGSANESGTQQQTVSITNDDNETTADSATVDEDSSIQVDVLSNDVGNGSALNPASVAIVASASNGTTSINTANGVITYTPAANFNGSDAFSYTVSDVQGNASASTAVNVTVTAVNDSPVAVADTATVAEDGSVVIDVVANDTDIDGANEVNSASLAISAQPTNGSVVVANSQVTYTPSLNYFGSDSFEYTVSDNSGAVSNAATVTVNVSGSNDAPTVVDDTVQTEEDTAISIAVLSNDSDVDGTLDVSTVTVVVGPTNGSVTAQSDGSFSYTPAADFNGSDSFTYTVKDDQDAVSSQATVSITVNSVNDAPVAANDVAVLLEDSSLDINVAGNDSDVDSTLNLSSLNVAAQPAQGTVTLVNNMFRYTPAQNFDGNDQFTYTINDADGSTSNIATVAITVQSVNDAPLANDDTVTTDEDTPIDISILANDQDIDGTLDATSIVIGQPANGSVELNNGVATYTPADNFNGSDQFTYTVNDDSGEASNSATVMVTVTSVNDLPVISGSPASSVLEGAAYAFTPTLSDIEGDTLSVSASNLPAWLTLNSETGELSGAPVVGDAGVYDNIVLQVSDGQGTTNFTAFAIEVIGDNDTDGLANSEDLDDDNDGMSDEFEIANGFNVFDPSDATQDADNDGLSNLNEQNAGSNPLADDQAPEITGVETLNINATGLLTPVTGLVTPTSVDALDGEVSVSLVGGAPANLAPGSHQVTWFAVDAAGNRAEQVQQIHVHPLISLGKDQVVGEGVNGRVRVLLNGLAPSYPLTVAYEVGGSADNTDHNLQSGEVVFEQGELTKNIPFATTEDDNVEVTEHILVSLTGDANFGAKKTHTITVVEENVAPQVELAITQGGVVQLIVEQSSGAVNFSVQINDPNPNDQHTVEWLFTGGVTTDEVSDTQRQLNPADVEPGVYRATVTVTDNGLPPISNELSISYRVVTSLPALSATQDSDGDGISDSDEGWLDDDQDGQPNYLDVSSQSNVLNEVAEDGFTFLIETEPGLKMVLGERALSNDGRGAKVEPETLSGALQIPADEVENISGYFDFVVNDLPVIGQSVNIVIPQRMAIAENVVYRKFDGVWFTFVEDANNSLMSAPGEQGACPPPESDEYRPGLNAGDWCVQLTIEDGGPNDADGMANGSVIDPGGVGSLVNTSVKSSGSGGGSFGLGWIVMMISMVMAQYARQITHVGRRG